MQMTGSSPVFGTHSPDPVKIDAGMSITTIAWSHTGNMLTVAGSQIRHTGSDKEISVVQFYTPFGDVSSAVSSSIEEA